jgi:hypothetical protein
MYTAAESDSCTAQYIALVADQAPRGQTAATVGYYVFKCLIKHLPCTLSSLFSAACTYELKSKQKNHFTSLKGPAALPSNHFLYVTIGHIYVIKYVQIITWKSQNITAIGRGRFQDCQTSRIQHSADNRLTDGGEDVDTMHRLRFTIQEGFWCSFPSGAEYGWEDHVN